MWESNLLFTDTTSTYEEAVGLSWKDLASFGTLIAALLLPTHSRTRGLPFCRRSLGTYLVVPAPPHAGLGLAAIRRNHHPDPCRHDLEDLAIEHGMGHRHACGDQHALQRNLSPDAFSSRAPPGRQVGLEKALAR